MAAPPLYSEDSEDSVLRNFLDEEMYQHVQTSSPIQEMPEESGFMANPMVDRKDSPQSRHSRTSHNRRHSRQASSSSKSSKNPDELLQRLLEQTREANTLRRALQLAVDRMHANANEAAQSERSRVQAQTAEYFHKLNESRIAAQQEALQASQDLRIYQLELQSAQEEARRARDLLAMVERERHSAEQAAKEAREQTRELYRRYMTDYSWHSGRDDAMRAGIEEGILRERLKMLGHEMRSDPDYSGDRMLPEHLLEGRPMQPIQPMEQGRSQMSTGHQGRPEPGGFRSAFSEPNIHQQQYEDEQAPNIQVVSPSGAHIQQPVPVTFPHPDPAPAPDQRAPSPAVQIYSLDIPSAAALERQYSTRSVDPVRKSKGPWLTAEELMALRNANQPQQPYEHQNVGNVTFEEPPQPQHPPKKPKESWYRSLRRKLTGKSKPKPETLAPYGPYSKYSSRPEPDEPPTPPQPQSWYVQKLSPHVQSSGVGVPFQPSVETASISKMSMNGPPVAASNASQRSGAPGRRHRRAESLSIINEDPMHAIPPESFGSVKSGQPRLRSVSMDQGGDLASLHPSIGQSTYAQPRMMENWRNSAATGQSSQRPQNRGPRRPANLTVPAPLALDVPGSVPPGALAGINMSDSSGFLKPTDRRSSRSTGKHGDPVGPPQASAPIGIDVQSPSNSPSEATGSALPDRGYLSPSSSHHVPITQPSMHSLTSGRRTQPAPPQHYQPAAPAVARPPSRGNQIASPTPSRAPGQSFMDSPQGAPNLLGLSAANDPSKPPVPRKSPRQPESSLQPEEPIRAASRLSQKSRTTARASPPEHRAPSVSGHMRAVSDPQWGRKTPSVRSRKTTMSTENGQGQGTPAGSFREHTLIRVPSNNSLNSNTPYARYRSEDYLDPAFFGVGDRLPAPQPRRRTPSAESSTHLSYMDDPRLKG